MSKRTSSRAIDRMPGPFRRRIEAELSAEEAGEAARNAAGFFFLLAEWARNGVSMPSRDDRAANGSVDDTV